MDKKILQEYTDARELVRETESGMTRKRLKAYISMRDEIAELKEKLRNLSKDGSLLDSSVINDYSSGHPVPQAVVGMDWKKYDRYRSRYSSRIAELETECAAVEEYIESIADSMTRRMFRMYFIEGLSQSRIAEKVHAAQATVSKKINAPIPD